MINFNNTLVKGAAVALVSSAFAMSAYASGSGGGCSMTRTSVGSNTFYVPSGGPGTYNILGWGNGTGGTSSTYRGLLEATAKDCILVAAANTANSGTGSDVQAAVNAAKSRYASKVGSNPKVCTSGHSQGGGGSFNAANRLGASVAKCVIGVQPDTVYTTSIYRPVASSVDVACIFSTLDVLAPALPFNSLNCRTNSTRYTERLTSGDHFTVTYGDGGAPGDAMRSFARQWLGK
jgi:hypothetical protein